MPSATTSNLEALLKIRYPNGIAYQGVKQSRFFNLCPKTTDFGGSGKQIKVSVSPGTGGSSDFAKALANRGPAQHVTFTVSRKYDYIVGSLENEVIKATMGDKNAVLAALTDEFDKKGKEFGMRLSRRCWGNEGGALGVALAITTSSFTLATPGDIRNFYPGQVLQFASDNGTGTSPTGQRAGTVTVSKVSMSSAGVATVTCTGNVTAGIAAATDGDTVFSDGDYGTAPSGVLGWIPTSDPTGSFLGVDRTTHINALSGFRVDQTGKDLIEAFNAATAAGFPLGSEGESAFVGGTVMSRLQNTLEGKAITRDVKGKGEVSYKGLVVYTTYGEVTVLPEPYCPDGKILITSMSDWEIASLGELPHYTDTGHGNLQQESAADARQFRLAGYWNILNKNPAGSILLSV
jgi:hypothetical protein